MNTELKRLIQNLWTNNFIENIGNMMVDVSLYPSLRSEIPDKYIYLEALFEIDESSEAFEPYIAEYEIAPIIAGYGNQIICVGYGENNFGKVYYFDFDFGAFNLGCSLNEFSSALKTSDKRL